uniref:Uncharacterized protein n=1 Tax=Glossina palpalis gambiensis TaxID=67801 RepID=A0A1B0AQP3_9MUSC
MQPTCTVFVTGFSEIDPNIFFKDAALTEISDKYSSINNFRMFKAKLTSAKSLENMHKKFDLIINDGKAFQIYSTIEYASIFLLEGYGRPNFAISSARQVLATN